MSYQINISEKTILLNGIHEKFPSTLNIYQGCLGLQGSECISLVNGFFIVNENFKYLFHYNISKNTLLSIERFKKISDLRSKIENFRTKAYQISQNNLKIAGNHLIEVGEVFSFSQNYQKETNLKLSDFHYFQVVGYGFDRQVKLKKIGVLITAAPNDQDTLLAVPDVNNFIDETEYTGRELSSGSTKSISFSKDGKLISLFLTPVLSEKTIDLGFQKPYVVKSYCPSLFSTVGSN